MTRYKTRASYPNRSIKGDCMKFFSLILSIVLFSPSAFAERVIAETTINRIYTYEKAGAVGDLAIKIDNAPVGCEAGYWLKASDTAGYKNSVSFLVSAFHANSKIYLSGLTENRWSGSSGNYCQADIVALIK